MEAMVVHMVQELLLVVEEVEQVGQVLLEVQVMQDPVELAHLFQTHL
jgi:hypothetical protein|tara:strand:+ start:232 stop:372 length:141 start_codon:yes stop_codon:yes gene_type:complete